MAGAGREHSGVIGAGNNFRVLQSTQTQSGKVERELGRECRVIRKIKNSPRLREGLEDVRKGEREASQVRPGTASQWGPRAGG